MKVVYDHQAFNLQARGGVSRYFSELASRLPDLSDCATEIVAPVFTNQYLAGLRNVLVRGRRVPALRFTNWLRRSAADCISCSILRHRQDVDIFHETFYSQTECAPRGCKRVLTVFDMISEKFLRGVRGNDELLRTKAAAIARADHIICISENTRRDLEQLLGVGGDKVSVVHLGHSLMTRAGERSSSFRGRRPYLLFVGTRGLYKNFPRLVEAYARSATLREGFDLLCFGGPQFSGEEKAMIDSQLASREAVFHMEGDDDLLARVYRGAAALVYPSRYEGFGLPPLEAMSLDCPVICSNASSMPEIAGDAAMYFDPEDIDDMKSAVERVVTDSSLSSSLIARGRARARLFTWDRCARETYAVYEALLEARAE